jgi:hypothetical protein
VNSIPKAGTHLLTSELERFKEMKNSRCHLDISKVGNAERLNSNGFPLIDLRKVASEISGVRKGQFFSAHLYWTKPLEDLLGASDVATIFMMRDPRDIVLSRMHYALGLRRHKLHDFLNRLSDNAADRLRVFVEGHENPFVRPLRCTLEGYLPWARESGVLTVRFEDLVGERGGGSTARKLAALQAISEHCGIDSGHLAELASSSTGPTPTMRKGRIGGWRDEMPEEVVSLIKRECGDLLEAYGYAVD